MLGKLIKYDLKYSARIFLLVHGVFLLACIFMRLLFMNRIDFEAPAEKYITLVTLIMVVAVFLLSAVTITTALLIALRFYRNLFSREGYLSWTLPASSSEHLLAKFISGYLIMAADILLVAAGLVILLTGRNIVDAYRQAAPELEPLIGSTLGVYAGKMVLFSILFGFASVVQIYFSIALGQLFADHRVLLAITFYFLTTVIVQILSSVLAVITGLSSGWFVSDNAAFNLGQYTDSLYLIMGVLMAVLAVAEYIATNYIMKRKINLI